MGRWSVAVLCAAACGRTVEPARSTLDVSHCAGAPAGAGSAAGPATFAPVSAPADGYNEPAAAPPPSALGDAVLAAVQAAARRAGSPAPGADARLSQACRDLAELVPRVGAASLRIDDRAVAFALQHSGIIEPSVQLLFGRADPEAPRPFVGELAPRLAELLRGGSAVRVGVGVARRQPDGTAAVVVALQGSAVSTLPIPRTVAGRGAIVVDAVLSAPFHDPEVFVTDPDGEPRQIAVAPGRPGGFRAAIACDARPGRHQIEIVASGATGATVLANFPVWCAAEPPAALTLVPDGDAPAHADAAEEARRLFDRINHDRSGAGIPDLAWDDAVAAVARDHADELKRTGVVGHVSPASGAPEDRVRAAGIVTRLVLENVARGHGVAEVHRALMDSPGHRANVLSRAATRAGIGVALGELRDGERALFVTELFTCGPGEACEERPRCAAVSPR